MICPSPSLFPYKQNCKTSSNHRLLVPCIPIWVIFLIFFTSGTVLQNVCFQNKSPKHMLRIYGFMFWVFFSLHLYVFRFILSVMNSSVIFMFFFHSVIVLTCISWTGNDLWNFVLSALKDQSVHSKTHILAVYFSLSSMSICRLNIVSSCSASTHFYRWLSAVW